MVVVSSEKENVGKVPISGEYGIGDTVGLKDQTAATTENGMKVPQKNN